MSAGTPGVLHGNRTYLLQDDDGQILDAHSISAGLDYPGVGPEHAWLQRQRAREYVPIPDDEALEAFQLCPVEGIIPALESAQRIAQAMKLAPTMGKDADHHRQSLRPRRQGHAHRRQDARHGDLSS